MTEKIKQQILLAAISQCVAERDCATANISSMLEHGGSVTSIKEEFEKVSKAEMTIDTIQIYYRDNMPLPKQDPLPKQEEAENNDSIA